MFAPVELFDLPTRRRLASLLPTPPGRAPVLFAADLATVPLPAASQEPVRLGPTITAALKGRVLAGLAEAQIGSIVPALSTVVEALGARRLPARIDRCLDERGVTSWRSVADLSVGELVAWPGVGAHTVATLVGLAVDVAADHMASAAIPSRCVQLTLLPAQVPAVGELLDRLDEVFAAVGDDRRRAVFAHCVLGTGGGVPLDLLSAGVELGVGYERVRQLQAQGEERARAAAVAPTLT
ncbi:MAG: hypothetical protein M3527_07715, partial [Actinomycetota bacterium]|nr:hypothetical protein [Actinomycetota bacterium]